MEVSSTVRDNFMLLVKDFFPSLTMHDPLYNALALGTILTIAIVIYIFARLIVRPEIARWVSKTTNIWDNALQEHGFFRRLMHLFPALFIFLATPVLIEEASV